MHESIIQNLTDQFTKNSWTRKDLLIALFEDTELKDMYQNEIRHATMVGNIANKVLIRVGNLDFCKILAIGDIQYFDNLATEWQGLVGSSLTGINTMKLQGYDLGGLGSPELRAEIARYMAYYYNLSLLTSSVENEIILSYGGTDSFVAILNTLKILAKGNRIHFIYPEASFLANVKIAELFLGEENCIALPKPNPVDFFFSQEQVEGLYRDKIGTSDINVFYITSVGNPTGNKVDSENMYQVLKQVQELDPSAVFILDNVYVGLLPNTQSHELFFRIFSDDSLMKRIIFTESISKTLGTTGIRLGWTWTLNPIFSNEVKKYTSLTKAGFSKILDEFTLHLLANPRIFDFQNRVYDFWSRQRLGFMEYMKNNFSELFDFRSSPTISDREGIYVLLKIRGNQSKEEIFAETGIVGVGITLSDGDYIRYAFGNVKEF